MYGDGGLDLGVRGGGRFRISWPTCTAAHGGYACVGVQGEAQSEDGSKVKLLGFAPQATAGASRCVHEARASSVEQWIELKLLKLAFSRTLLVCPSYKPELAP